MKTKRHLGSLIRNAETDTLTADEAVDAALEGHAAFSPDEGPARSARLDNMSPRLRMATDGRHAVVATDDTYEVYELAPGRRLLDDAEKLAIITEYLHGDGTLQDVQRRHGLGHSTLTAWMHAFGMTPKDGSQSRRNASLERENKALGARIRVLEATTASLREENRRLRDKMRAAKAALTFNDTAATEAA